MPLKSDHDNAKRRDDVTTRLAESFHATKHLLEIMKREKEMT